MGKHSGPPKPPPRHHLPDERKSITHKFVINGQKPGPTQELVRYKGYLIVGLYENGQPGELFVHLAKQGGLDEDAGEGWAALGGALDAWCTEVSLGLQCGMPLQLVIDKFWGWPFEPSGETETKAFVGQAPFVRCKSPIDYIVQWLKHEFIRGQA
jgi:ribonucleoside-diphosphate reductase alpha chain